ncbi:hypothetical protein [Paenibacillus macerans]|uniref:hypothetical protein n=1 Tax=Paenibacillus macerans TaxID=44252 RepID=UPI00204189E2|nr:hypothetical protein [Paenibacillus macerans]MCM3702384.1 hypothetical protein [Paenibacillus macerans]
MIFESENGARSEKISSYELENYLKMIDGSSNSYAYLEMKDGSYIQVGGGPLEFTVEVRQYLSEGDGGFAHKKAKQKDSVSSGTKKILISGSLVDVQTNQVMNLKMVILLFKSFLDGDVFPTNVEWDDITSMFK